MVVLKNMNCLEKVMLASAGAMFTHMLVRSGILGYKHLHTSNSSSSSDLCNPDKYLINNQGFRSSYL